MNKQKKRGFTLIELLVTISIVGLLLGVVLVSLNGARSKSRDTKRKSDLLSVQAALEMYYSANRSYPLTEIRNTPCSAIPQDQWPPYWYFSSRVSNQDNPTFCIRNRGNAWVPNLVRNYLPNLPKDPNNTAGVSVYYYTSNGTDYKLLAGGMETPEGKNWAANDGGYQNPAYPSSGSSRNACANADNSDCYYELFTPGGWSW